MRTGLRQRIAGNREKYRENRIKRTSQGFRQRERQKIRVFFDFVSIRISGKKIYNNRESAENNRERTGVPR